MGALSAFLQPSVAGQTKEVIISERFKDENGKPVPFVLQAISQAENEQLAKLSKIRERRKGQIEERLDNIAYQRRLIIACVKEPDLSAKELCDYYGVVDPMDVPGVMLSVGEYGLLVDAISELNGINDAQEKLEAAKNS